MFMYNVVLKWERPNYYVHIELLMDYFMDFLVHGRFLGIVNRNTRSGGELHISSRFFFLLLPSNFFSVDGEVLIL